MENKIEKLLNKRGQDIKEEWIDLVKSKILLCESPIEKLFLIEWYYQNDNFYFGGDLKNYIITPQYKIGNYRVDFMIYLDDENIESSQKKKDSLIVEIDSYLWHGSDPEQFTKEKERERMLIKNDWSIIRFSGREIYRDVNKCVNETIGYFLNKGK